MTKEAVALELTKIILSKYPLETETVFAVGESNASKAIPQDESVSRLTSLYNEILKKITTLP